MNTIAQSTINEFVDLVYSMMISPGNFDMDVVETLVEDFMITNGLGFKDYNTFLTDIDGNDNAYYWMNFTTTKEYFIDAINTMSITKERTRTIILMTLKS